MIETTDPATELSAVFNDLVGFQHKGACRDALAARFGCTPDDGTFFAILNALSCRCDRLADMVSAEQELAERRDEVLQAIKMMRTLFGTGQLHAPWAGRRDQCLKPQYLATLGMAYLVIRRSHPLRRLSEAERNDLLEQIDDVLQDARLDPSLPARIIEDAFLGLKLIVERFTFFGHSALVEKLLLTSAEIRAAEPRHGSQANGDLASLFRKGKVALGVIVGALIYADATFIAAENHYHRAQVLLEHLSTELPSPEMKCLPPPVSPTTDEVAET